MILLIILLLFLPLIVLAKQDDITGHHKFKSGTPEVGREKGSYIVVLKEDNHDNIRGALNALIKPSDNARVSFIYRLAINAFHVEGLPDAALRRILDSDLVDYVQEVRIFLT